MQLILREDVDNLGKKGDKVVVASGYARNFLLPKKLAMEINDSNLRQIEKEKKVILAKLHKEKEEAEALAAQLKSVRLTFKRKVHGGELYAIDVLILADVPQRGVVEYHSLAQLPDRQVSPVR